MKKTVLVLATVLTLGAVSVTAMAANVLKTPAEIVAGLTERTAESVTEEKAQSGKTYGAIANEAGVLDEFKSQRLEQKKALLSEKVADGTITQDRADSIIAAMEKNQADCDGTGSGMNGRGTCAGSGTCTGGGMNGNGRGSGLGRGSCGSGLGLGAGN